MAQISYDCADAEGRRFITNLRRLVMSSEKDLTALVDEIRKASGAFERNDTAFGKRMDKLEDSINELYRKTSRPGFGTSDGDDTNFERKSATEMCRIRRAITVPKIDGGVADDYVPSGSEVDEALTARKALKSLFRNGDARLDHLQRKSLSSFSFGTNAFLLPPEMSNRVLSCLVSPTDISGLVDHVQISAASVKFLIDNVRMGLGAWACEASCFANNPVPDLQDGLGELEIKAETIRFVQCVNSDLLADASFNVEQWMIQKVSDGMRITINDAIIAGDGLGKPMGLLNPQSGIAVCETAPATPPGMFTWQDLVMLKFEIPQQWWDGSVYLMNQRTAGLLMTMSSTDGRPLLSALPAGMPGFALAGSPIVIASQMPDVAPGSTPILFGNLRAAYTVVDRKAVTMQTDPYSAGYCVLYKFEARVGGACTCPNSVRLLRIR
jgi:HK97 family phage major capsid protein